MKVGENGRHSVVLRGQDPEGGGGCLGLEAKGHHQSHEKGALHGWCATGCSVMSPRLTMCQAQKEAEEAGKALQAEKDHMAL